MGATTVLVLLLASCLLADARRLPSCGGKDDDSEEGPRDCYQILGLEQSAEAADIKRAYRKLALKFHPDKHNEPDKKEEMQKQFVLLAHAYDTLSTKREEYDRGEVRADEGEWQDFDSASKTYQHAMVEENMYTWGVFFAILAMPVGGFVWHEWKWWIKTKNKQRRAEEKLEANMQKAAANRESSVRTAPAPVVQRRVNKQLEDSKEATRKLQEQVDQEQAKAALAEQAAAAAAASALRTSQACSKPARDWTQEELALLAKAMSKFPGGTLERWDRVSQYVGTRSETEVKAMASTIRLRVKAPTAVWEQVKPSVEEKAQPVSEDQWTPEQQRALELALQKHPASDKERWDKVAVDVGKTRKQVIKRCKEIRDKLASKSPASQE